MKIFSLVFLLGFCLSFIPPSHSKQTMFTKTELADAYQFNYQWADQNNNQQQLSFSLSKQILFEQFRGFRAYNATIAKHHALKSLQQHLQQTPLPNVMVSFESHNDETSVKIKGTDREAINQAYSEVAQLEAKFNRAYLDKNFYQLFLTYDQYQGIKPDHRRFALLSSPHLAPIKQSIFEQFPIKKVRQISNYVLAFVQSIPYSQLESRVSSSGAGFNHPMKLLWENQGDCDSKVTLTAAILRALMPKIKMVLVFIEGHALIGIEGRPNRGAISIKYDRRTYLLAEPTGPAKLYLGEISTESNLAIANGYYTVEAFY